jgi:hypothetical protein
VANRVSQDADEVLYLTTAAKNRVSQESAEVLQLIHIVANRVSQVAVEVLTTPPSTAATTFQVVLV